MHLLSNRLTKLNWFSSLALLTLLASLSACGGGAVSSTPGNINTPAPVATNAFIELAQTASCNNLKNRMFVIDQKLVFWDKAGTCSDAAYAQTLYGNTAQSIICTNADSIAGPRFSCTDKESESLFKTMLQNLEKADLGLGQSHQVRMLAIAAGKQTVLPMFSLNSSFYRNAAPANLLIKDASGWDHFWNQANIQADSIDQKPDFSSSMIVASFFKTPNNCSSTQILRLASDGQKLNVEFAQDEDLPVEFVEVSKLRVAHELLATGQDSRIQQQRQLVVRDQQAWSALWNEHTQANLPAIDFSKQMVVAIFLGQRANSCFAIEDVSIWRSNGVSRVSHRDSSPAPSTVCAMMITSPYMFLVIPRNDDQFEFNSVQIQI
ncbi:MAG: hypothetical protein HYR92_02205 [Burkholderiales bacterium]|nr:hypothetical protein [Burkholderiales bacterium]